METTCIIAFFFFFAPSTDTFLENPKVKKSLEFSRGRQEFCLFNRYKNLSAEKAHLSIVTS